MQERRTRTRRETKGWIEKKRFSVSWGKRIAWTRTVTKKIERKDRKTKTNPGIGKMEVER